MNRKQYQKNKNKYDIANKKLYKVCQSKFSKMSREDQQYWVDKANRMKNGYQAPSNKAFKNKYRPYIVMAENSKWAIHRNWVYIPSWCSYRKDHPTKEVAMKELLKIMRGCI